MNDEYDNLLQAIATMKKRNRGLDLCYTRALLRLADRHNTFMGEAIRGDRECENLAVENLNKLQEFVRL